jgi:hypothetical protein
MIHMNNRNMQYKYADTFNLNITAKCISLKRSNVPSANRAETIGRAETIARAQHGARRAEASLLTSRRWKLKVEVEKKTNIFFFD